MTTEPGAPIPRRGEIWLAELDKRRPVLVMTRDPMGSYLNSVIVGPITSSIRGLTTEVPLTAADGVRHPSVVNFDNLQLLERSRLHRRVGVASPATMRLACDAVTIALGCDAR